METGQNELAGAESGRSKERKNGSSDGMYISLSQAAKLWGKSKNTLSVDLGKGKLQWVEHQGKRCLMMGQLVELYGPLEKRTSTEQHGGAEVVPPGDAIGVTELKGLRAVLEVKEEQIALLKEQLEYERQNAERWHRAFQETKMLPPSGADNRPGFIARIFRRPG